MTVTANALPNGRQQYFDLNGNPLTGGAVYFYIPLTTTFKNTWVDPERLALNTNPVLLDASGEADIFGDGIYRQILKDVNGNTIWDKPSIQFVTVGGDLIGQLPNPTISTTVVQAQLAAAPNKNPPVDNDRFPFLDSTNANALVYGLWSQIKSAMQTALALIFDLRYAGILNVAPGFAALKVQTVSNSSVTIAAASIALFDSTGVSKVGLGVNVSANISASGVNGLDTGVEAASTWYYNYVIFNPTTVAFAALISASPTAPTMPAGYTFKSRVGAMRNDGASNLLQIIQYGRKAQYVVGVNPLTLPLMSSGAAGTFSTTLPVFAVVAVGNFVPPTAGEIFVTFTTNFNGSGGANVLVAPNVSYGGWATATPGNPPPLAFSSGNSAAIEINMVLESTNIAWVSGGAGGAIFCNGWVDNL